MKFRRNKSKNPDSIRYCLQINNDEMLFFPTEERMKSYFEDYNKKIPIHKLNMFRVEFYNYCKQ